MLLTNTKLFNNSNNQKHTKKTNKITITNYLNTTITNPLKNIKIKNNLILTTSNT